MKYKLVIFDFDGTLADSFPWALSIVDEIADKFGLNRIDKSEVESLRGYDARQLARHYGVRWWKLPSMVKDARNLMARDANKIPLFEGVNELLKSLSEMGIILSLVTANSQQNVEKVLGPANIALISYFACGVSVFGKKSKFLRILQKAGIPANEAICIGDEIRDIQAAKKANIPVGAVSWGYTRVDALLEQNPDEIFNSLAEILIKIQQSE